MKAFRGVAWVAVVLLGVGLIACGGGGKYAKASDLLNKQIGIMESYAAAMEKAGSAQEVAAAMDQYTTAMKEMVPEMKDFEKNYPEIKAEKEPPEELKPLMKKMEEIAGRVMSASMKAAQFMQDPAVQAAQQRFGEVMGEMR